MADIAKTARISPPVSASIFPPSFCGRAGRHGLESLRIMLALRAVRIRSRHLAAAAVPLALARVSRPGPHAVLGPDGVLDFRRPAGPHITLTHRAVGHRDDLFLGHRPPFGRRYPAAPLTGVSALQRAVSQHAVLNAARPLAKGHAMSGRQHSHRSRLDHNPTPFASSPHCRPRTHSGAPSRLYLEYTMLSSKGKCILSICTKKLEQLASHTSRHGNEKALRRATRRRAIRRERIAITLSRWWWANKEPDNVRLLAPCALTAA